MGDGVRDKCMPSYSGNIGMCDPGGDGGEGCCEETVIGRRTGERDESAGAKQK